MAIYDVIIIGAGPAGLASAYYCAQKEKKVLLIEQHTIANQHGSSVGASRQWRLQYSEDHLAKLTLDTKPLWDELSSHASAPLIDKVGSLWFGDSELETTEGEIERTQQVMSKNSIPYTPINAEQLIGYGMFNFPSRYRGFFQEDGGSINVNETIKTLHRLCLQSSFITIQENSPVVSIRSFDTGCAIEVLDGTQYLAKKLIICAGPYAQKTLKMLNIQFMLPIEEWSSAYFKVREPEEASVTVGKQGENKKLEVDNPNSSHSQFPNTTWFAFQNSSGEDPGLYYGFPASKWEMPGYVKIGAAFTFRRINEPSQSLGRADPTVIKLIEDFVKKHLPGLDPKAVLSSVCLANPTPDENFILDFAPSFVPGNKNIIIFDGSWSFKFIPMVGKLCAELATDEIIHRDISHFNITRVLSKDCQHAALLKDGLLPLSQQRKVVIVGAGIAGLTAGHLLYRAGYQVEILEANSRVGGRIYTIREFEEGQYGEAGAMRIPSEHKRVRMLIDLFKLQTEKFIYEDALHNGLVYINGQRLTHREYKANPALLGFRGLSIPESDSTAEQLLDEAIQPLLLALYRDPENGWKRVAQKYGHLSVMEYLREYTTLSPEAIYKMGLLLNMEGTHMTSLIEAIRDQTDLSPGNSFYRIVGGMDNLPKAFLRDTTFASKVHLNEKVVNIDRNESIIKVVTKSNQGKQEEKTYLADYVVISTTFPALSHIHVTPPFSQKKRHAIENLHYDNSVKIFLQFRERFWEKDFQIEGGYSISDTRLRFTYYPSPSDSSKYGVVLASYTWGTEAQKWEGLSNAERITQATKYLAEMHGRQNLDDIFVRGFSYSWQNDPYSIGAFALFNPYQETDFAEVIRQPEGKIHFAGEHASNRHAWIEGAIESAIDTTLAIYRADTQAEVKAPSLVTSSYKFLAHLLSDSENKHAATSSAILATSRTPTTRLGAQQIDTKLPLGNHTFFINSDNIKVKTGPQSTYGLSLFSNSNEILSSSRIENSNAVSTKSSFLTERKTHGLSSTNAGLAMPPIGAPNSANRNDPTAANHAGTKAKTKSCNRQ